MLLKELAPRLAGVPGARMLATDPRDSQYAVAQYGGSWDSYWNRVQVAGEYISRDSASGKPELMSAGNSLAAGFGLGAICAKNTYRGNWPTDPSHRLPGLTPKPLAKPVWFACTAQELNSTGYVIGWTSKKVSWLVAAKNEQVARTLMTALYQARRATARKP